VLFAGVWIHNRVEDALRHSVSEKLQAILQTDIAALEFWLGQEKSNAMSWAEESSLRSMTQHLISRASGPGALQAAPEQARLRSLLEPLPDTNDYLGFAIIDTAGFILAASEERMIAERLTRAGQARLARAFQQQAVWNAPAWREQYLESEALQEDVSIMSTVRRAYSIP
jgi:hypothetical protein